MDHNDKPYSRTSVSENSCQRLETDAFCGHSFTVSVGSQDTVAHKTVDEAINYSLESNKGSCLPDTKYSEISTATLDGIPIRYYSSFGCYSAEEKSYFISNGKMVFILSQLYSNDESVTTYKDLNNQILASFKFIN